MKKPPPEIYCSQCGYKIIFKEKKYSLGFEKSTGERITSKKIIGACSGESNLRRGWKGLFDLSSFHDNYLFKNGVALRYEVYYG